MEWVNYGAWERVQADHSHNHASEIIRSQDLHAALIRGGACYDGDIMWSDSWAGNYRQNSPILASGTFTGFNATWTLASGHHWFDDGVHWRVNEANDICRDF
jgi:hypothetical protein